MKVIKQTSASVITLLFLLLQNAHAQVIPVSFERIYSSNALSNTVNIGENSEITHYGNRLYVVDHDSSGLIFLHKLDLGGNVVWSKRFAIQSNLPGSMPALQVDAFGGHVFLINESGQSMGRQHIIKIDTTSGNIADTTGFDPCAPANLRSKNKSHVILDNGLIVTYACKGGTGRACLFVTNSTTGELISAREFIEPSAIGVFYDTRITKLSGNSVLLYGRASNGLYYFSKITDPITLANDGLHILKQNTFLGSLFAESATEYIPGSDKMYMLFRNNTTNLIIETDTALSEFKGHRFVNNNFMMSNMLHKNNKLYVGAYTMNVIGGTGDYQVSVFNQSLIHQQTNRFTAVPFNTVQTIPFRALNLTSDQNQNIYMAFDARSVSTSSNNNQFHLYKLNASAQSTCSSLSTITPSFAVTNLQDSLVATLSNTAGVIPSKLSYTITQQNSNLNSSLNCIISSSSPKQLEKNQIRIYPNPAGNEVVIESVNENSTVNIYTITGKLVFKGISKSGSLKIDTEKLENGVYIVKSMHEDGTVMNTDKLVISR